MKMTSVVLALLAGSSLNLRPQQTATPSQSSSLSSAEKRETVLDRRVHLKPGILEVPKLPPLCDELKLEKHGVNIGDCQLYCETEGRGLPLALINGGPGGTHHDFHPWFGRAAAFATVVYYDQRGCGQSAYARGKRYSLAQAVDDLDKLRQALQLDRWVVLGWSYGGVVAESYTLKYPEHVAGVVLVGASDDGMHLDLQPTRQFDVLSPEERKKISEVHSDGSLSLAQSVFNAHLNGDWKRQSFYRPTREELARTALYGWRHAPEFRRDISQDLGQLDLRGQFDGCPLAILLLEGKYDLTWGADKAEKFARCFPGSRLVLFDASAHAPFADEPDKFFAVLREFVNQPPARPDAIARWKQQVATRQAEKRKSPDYVILNSGWGQTSSEKLAQEYSPEWLPRLSEPRAFLRLGFALYDTKKYSEALTVFRRMEQAGDLGVALVWQGHMLDLLDQRAEAVAAYQKALAAPLNSRHDQYGIVLSRTYLEQRIRTAFTPVRNRLPD